MSTPGPDRQVKKDRQLTADSRRRTSCLVGRSQELPFAVSGLRPLDDRRPDPLVEVDRLLEAGTDLRYVAIDIPSRPSEGAC